MHQCVIQLLIIAIAATSCSTQDPGADPQAGRGYHAPTYPERAIIHYQSLDSWDAEIVREAAKSDIIVLPIWRCLSPASSAVLSELKRLNPSVQIIGYQNMLGVFTLGPDTSYARSTMPYALDLYESVKDDWAWTTAADTLMIWKDLISLNPIKNGELNTSLIDEIVGLLERYRSSGVGALDGIMHDYFMERPNINPSIRDQVEGEIDFDGDGVTFDDDPDERALFVLWQKEYVREIRNRLGEDFIQIGNGRMPQEDGELAELLNGILYEQFPNLPWNFTDRQGFLRLLDNQRAGYLSKAKGRTWSILANDRGSESDMFCLLSSMLADCFYNETQGSFIFKGWTLNVESGSPLGPTIIEGQPDSLLIVRRSFQRGEVRISFLPSGQRESFEFKPWGTPR
jgi:hypothetical protein